MTATDKWMLEHLQIHNSYLSDTYLCCISKNNKDRFMKSVMEKVRAWVEHNGGKFQQLTDTKTTTADRKGYVVRIIFPCHCKRNMKELMATLY